MLIENITFSQSELNATSATIKTVTSIDLAVNTFNSRHYRPVAIKVSNASGATINFALFSDFEYTAYIADNTISDMLSVSNSNEESINDPVGKITKIMCSGTPSTHTSGVIFTVLKEAVTA